MSEISKLISVICTVKNGENTIEDTIQSVINQTFKTWEFIIVDDGSTDSSAKIVMEYCEKDRRIKLVKTKGIGRAKALNMGINLSKGEYIANIDADDLMHPQKLSIQSKLFEQHKDYFLLSTEYYIVHENEVPEYPIIEYEKSINNIDYKLLMKNLISHSSVLINKEKLNEIGGYNSACKTQVDYELWLRAYSKGFKIGKTSKQLTYKRIHVNQSFENKKRMKYVLNSVKLQLKYILKNKKYIYLIPIPFIRYFYLFLPFSIREKLTNLL